MKTSTNPAFIPFERDRQFRAKPKIGHVRPESPVTFVRNPRSRSSGNPGHLRPEYALFGTSRENVKQQARRLSELGFNLVRLHYHDSARVDPNIFGSQKSPDTQNLSSAMLDRLDWWIKCLKDEGIYVWLDLHVGRQLKAGDGIEGFDEISKGKPVADLRGYNYVNPSIQQAMKRFNEAYVNRVNFNTNTRYKDEPAIAAMLITNENDVTNRFGNALLPDKKVPKHNALYMAQADAFAAKHGLPRDKVWRA